MTQMDQWREHILQRTLWISTLLAAIAYLPGVFAAWKDSLWLLIVVNTLVLGLLFTVTLWQSLGLRTRATLFVGAWYLFSAFLLWILGPVGVGTVWLLAVPIFSALLFGYPGAWLGTALVAILALIYPFLPYSTATESVAIFNIRYTVAAWVAISGSLLFLSSLLSLAIAKLLAGLEHLVSEQAESNELLTSLMAKERALQEALLESRKQNAMGTLAGGIAHDFNNLLVPIMLASESARDEATPGSELRESLDVVVQSAERARNLVRQVLRFSQNIEIERTPINLKPIVDEAISLLRGSADPKVEIDCKNEVPDIHVLADADAIHQVLMNLGKNALLALPTENPRLEIVVSRNPDHEMVDLVVSDNGTGIPKTIQDRVFDPYFSTRSSGTGTGLGLAIVYRLVTGSMNGRLSFTSRENVGTTFTVSIPETKAPVADTSRPSNSNTETASGQKSYEKILVVDDEPLVCTTLKAMLEVQGYQVDTCNNAESILAKTAKDLDSTDVVIADKTMPGMGGLELAQRLREMKPRLRIILMSGYLTEEDHAIIKDLGLSGVLEKPFLRSQVLEVMNALPNS